MNSPIRKARKMKREAAKLAGLVFFDNGVPCEVNHQPIIRHVSTGACYHCRRLRLELKKLEADMLMPTSHKFYLVFRYKSGEAEIIGPFARRTTAINQYRKRYLQEYGVPCPADKFGLDEAADLEDSALAD
jgi:hypothetical protein